VFLFIHGERNNMRKSEEVEILLADLDETNISSILKTYHDVDNVSKKIEELREMLRVKIKAYLKERLWTNYKDKETKINVTISVQKRETINKDQLKCILSEADMSQITRITSFEKLLIVTPETRMRLKNYVKKKL